MATSTITQIKSLAQQISSNFNKLNEHLSNSWKLHDHLSKGSMRHEMLQKNFTDLIELLEIWAMENPNSSELKIDFGSLFKKRS